MYAADDVNLIDKATKINGTLTVKGSLTLYEPASATSDYVESLTIASLSKINHLIGYSAGDKPVITAGDGSTIGGVGFTGGALTGVTSINAGDEYAKFRVAPVDVDDNGEKHYIFRAGNLEVATDINAEGSLYKDITFTDTNCESNTVTLGEIVAASKATKNISSGTNTDYQNITRRVTYIEGIGGFEFRDDGRLTIGTSNTHSAMIDGGYGILVGHQSQVLKLLEHDSSVTDEQKEAYLKKIAGMSNKGVFAGGIELDNAKAYMKNEDGSLKAADGKFTVNADGVINANNKFVVDAKGAITAAGNKFYVKEDGKVQIEDELVISHTGRGTEADPHKSATLNIDNLTAINKLIKVTDEGVYSKVAYDTSGKPIITAGDGSTVGGVTISGGQLSVSYSGAPEGTARVNVSDLWKDHELVNNDEVYSNKKLKDSINTVESIANAASTQTAGIHRIAKDFDGISKAGTSIENTLEVYENGTVIINDNDDKVATVAIDRNRISIGNVSLIENDYVEKNGTIHYNQTINDYAKLDVKKGKIGYKVGNYSVTTSSATATGNYDVDQANKGTVFSNDTNYTRIDGAEINSVSGKNTGVLDGSWLELTHENGSKAVLRQGGLILTGINGLKTKLEDGELSYGTNSITVSELASDHDLVNDAKKGNEKLYSEINLVKGFANGIDDRTGGITNSYDPNDPNKTATIIEGVLTVDNAGTATITEGFKAGADGKNSLTITGLTAKEIRAGNNNTEFFVDGGGNVVADGTLSAAGGKFDVSSEGDITASGSLSVAGDKFRVNADGSINANNKFNIDTDGALRAANDKFTADKDGNVRAIGSLSAANEKFRVGTDGSINVNQKFIVDSDGTISSDGTLSVAGGKLFVNAEGKLTSASGSKIGDVTIDGESLSNGTNSITVSELASDHALVNDAKKGNEKLYSDLVDVQAKAQGLNTKTAGIERDTTGTTIENTLKVGSNGTVGTVNGNFTVGADGSIVSKGTLSVANGAFVVNADGVVTAGSMKMDNIEAADPNSGVTVGGVNLKNNNIKATGGKFNEIIVNENTASQVRIDSNGIKVGNNSAFVNEDGFKTSGYLYVGTKTSPTEDATDARFYVNGSNGSFKAADGAFTVDGDGALISASGSKIGDVTINGESLSNGTKSINVSNLADDHDLVNDSKKGNESLYTGLGSVQTLAQGLDTRTAGVERDTTGTAATTIEGKLKVSSDGTVKINEGEDQQVIIDSNGIKVGKNSSRMNDSYGFATTKDLYIGADSADAPTAAGSKFYVKGFDGSIKAANGKFTVDENGNVVAKGSSKSKILAAGTNGDEFVVDENGNLVSKGTLRAADGKFTVDADGALKAANDKFNVDKDGNVIANGALRAANGAFSVDISGNVITSGSVRLNSGANSTQLTAGGVSFIKDGKTTTIAGDTVTVSSSGVNKSFNLSDIADVGQNMTNLGNRIEAEETKRAQEVSRLDTAISDEKTKREQEVSRLDTAINDEKTKREQDVSRLDTAISDEKTKREQEVSRLDTAISDEKTKREQEVSRLDTAINDEKTKREQDVSRLDTAISDEKTKREQEVSRLDTAINDEKTKREQEVSRLDTAISDEKTKREQDVSRLDTAINDEKTKREQEVSRLDTAINDEKTKREQEVADLNGRVDAVNSRVDNINNDFNTAINDEKTKREQEVSRLDTAISDEKTKREQEVTRLDTAIADEAAARQADVARLDGRISDVSSRINKVGAMAAAISSLKTMGYDPESPTEFSVGLGQYKGETGVALGFFHYPNKNFMINVSLSTSSGEIMGGIGATWRFGHKSPQKLLDEQREAQVKKEIAAAEAYKAARAAKQTK